MKLFQNIFPVDYWGKCITISSVLPRPRNISLIVSLAFISLHLHHPLNLFPLPYYYSLNINSNYLMWITTIASLLASASNLFIQFLLIWVSNLSNGKKKNLKYDKLKFWLCFSTTENNCSQWNQTNLGLLSKLWSHDMSSV